jgi:O-antigen ligase
MKRLTSFFDNYLFYFLLALVIVMPVHAFMAISLGKLTGQQALLQSWKEAGLVIATVSAWGIFFTNKEVKQRVTAQPAAWTAKLFIAIALVVTVVNHSVGFFDTLLGIKTTLSFLLLFVVMQAPRFTKERWSTLIKSLLAVTSAVGMFAVAQVYLLPIDWLTRFGYGASTVIPYHLVDPAVNSIRIIATFSGPNQLGSFMIIPLMLSLWLVMRKKWVALIPAVLSAFALFHTFSRSAWIGAVIGVFTLLLVRLKGWWKLSLLAPVVAMATAAILLSGPVKAMTTDLTFYVFHGQFVDGRTNGSDSYRLDNAKAGVVTIQEKPLGYGLGTAGPASKNTAQPIITENSYLQIGIETGVIGLLVFMATVVLALYALWLRRHQLDEATPLLAALIGLSATNMFLHTWADSATALVLWGLIGYALAMPLTSKKS